MTNDRNRSKRDDWPPASLRERGRESESRGAKGAGGQGEGSGSHPLPRLSNPTVCAHSPVTNTLSSHSLIPPSLFPCQSGRSLWNSCSPACASGQSSLCPAPRACSVRTTNLCLLPADWFRSTHPFHQPRGFSQPCFGLRETQRASPSRRESSPDGRPRSCVRL